MISGKKIFLFVKYCEIGGWQTCRETSRRNGSDYCTVLSCRQIYRQICRQVGRLAYCRADIQVQAGRHSDLRVGVQAGRETFRLAGSHIVEQATRRTSRH